MWARYDDRRPFFFLMVALIAMTWLALVIWSISPYARFLDHDVLRHLEFTIGGEYLVFLVVFVAGWTLMTVAMMLPTSMPLVMLFRRLTGQRPDHLRLVVLLIAGYLGVWMLFGGLAHFGDLLVHGAVEQSRWLEANAWVIGAGTIMLAGIYQFTPLKYKCLEKCRSPLSFIAEHWRGSHEASQAFRLGAHHGLFCVGCCWSLMLLMFVVGVGNVGWMLALGAVMAVEKNMPWGKKISAPLGIALVGWSLVLVAAAAHHTGQHLH
jgi:predicted metal-binding membrane protein